jgi:hypothetical protein
MSVVVKSLVTARSLQPKYGASVLVGLTLVMVTSLTPLAKPPSRPSGTVRPIKDCIALHLVRSRCRSALLKLHEEFVLGRSRHLTGPDWTCRRHTGTDRGHRCNAAISYLAASPKTVGAVGDKVPGRVRALVGRQFLSECPEQSKATCGVHTCPESRSTACRPDSHPASRLPIRSCAIARCPRSMARSRGIAAPLASMAVVNSRVAPSSPRCQTAPRLPYW